MVWLLMWALLFSPVGAVKVSAIQLMSIESCTSTDSNDYCIADNSVVDIQISKRMASPKFVVDFTLFIGG